MAHNIWNIAVKPVTDIIYSGGFEGLVMTQTVNCIAVDTVRIDQFICTDLVVFKIFPKRLIGNQNSALHTVKRLLLIQILSI